MTAPHLSYELIDPLNPVHVMIHYCGCNSLDLQLIDPSQIRAGRGFSSPSIYHDPSKGFRAPRVKLKVIAVK